MYNQNLYGQANIQYQTEIESFEQNAIPGAELGTYQSTNYQPATTTKVTRLPTIYQTDQESTNYYDPNQAYTYMSNQINLTKYNNFNNKEMIYQLYIKNKLFNLNKI